MHVGGGLSNSSLSVRWLNDTRTVRRWIEAGDLVVHRVGGVVRIAEGDLRAFLALHRSRKPDPR